MLITRCAWHPRYYGSGRLLGVARWGNLRIEFTDGICQKCAARVRADLHGGAARNRPAAERSHWVPGVALVAVAVMIAVLLIARPTHEAPAPAIVAPAPPPPSPARLGPAEPAALPVTVGPAPARRATLTSRRPPAAVRATDREGRVVTRKPAVYHLRPYRDSAQSP